MSSLFPMFPYTDDVLFNFSIKKKVLAFFSATTTLLYFILVSINMNMREFRKVFHPIFMFECTFPLSSSASFYIFVVVVSCSNVYSFVLTFSLVALIKAFLISFFIHIFFCLEKCLYMCTMFVIWRE